jgi:hypothetical protein
VDRHLAAAGPALPAAAHGRRLGEPASDPRECRGVDIRGGNRASAHPVRGHFSEARGRGEDGEDPQCPHCGCSL